MREKDGRQRLTANRFGAIGRGVTDTNVPIPGPSFDPGAERLPCRKPGAGLPRRNRCGPGRAPEPSPAATAPRGRGGSLRPPDSPPEAPPGRARDGASARGPADHRHRKPLGRSVAAAARRAAAGALLLLGATLGLLQSAAAQTATFDLTLDPIAGDDTVNIAEKAAGLTFSGDLSSSADLPNFYRISLKAASATIDVNSVGYVDPTTDPKRVTWELWDRASILRNDISEPSVTIEVYAYIRIPIDIASVTRTIRVDLTAPSASYTAPDTLAVGVAIAEMTPSTTATDIASYSASGLPSGLSIDSATGVIRGAPDTYNPNAASATVTVTDTAGNPAKVSIAFPAVTGAVLPLSFYAIAGNNSVNIAENAAGFTISGRTGSEAGVSVTVVVATEGRTATSTSLTVTSGAGGAWSVNVPANAAYIAEPSATVTVSATKTGFTAPSPVTRTIRVDLTAPMAPTYTAPATLTVGEAITGMLPSGGVDILYRATGLPSGLTIDRYTGTISGTPDTANPNPATATVTVTDTAGNPADVSIAFPAVFPVVPLNVDAIAGDDTVNLAEKAAGFTISGDTGSEAGASVTVKVTTADGTASSTAPTVTSGDDGAWSVNVPADASYVTEPSVDVTVSASKTGITSPSPVTRTLIVDLSAPSASYPALATLKVGVAIADMVPSTSATDIDGYSATGLPSGLRIDRTTGVISGTPDTADVNPTTATVTVTDTAGNPADVSITFPAVAKPDQALTGFGYTPATVTFGDLAPTVTPPIGALGTLSYSAEPATVCTVHETSGALTLVGSGECVVTATAAGTPTYSETTATTTVTVLGVDQALTGFGYTPATVRFAGPAPTVTPPIGALGTLSYSAEPATVCTVDETSGALTLVGAGECVVTATAAGTATHNEASVTTTVTVLKGDQALTGFGYTPATVTFGDRAPTLAAPTGAEGPLSYSATPADVCTVDAASGALTWTGAGECVVTATAAETAEYDEAAAKFTVTVQPATLVLNVYILTHDNVVNRDNIVNIAEKEAGLTISGGTGAEPGVTVGLFFRNIVETQTTSSSVSATSTTWSLSLPGSFFLRDSSTQSAWRVVATKTGFAPAIARLPFTVDLTAPTAPTYTAPASLRVGEAIAAMSPAGGRDIASYSATGLPPGLRINRTTGVIRGTPDTANSGPRTARVTVTDTAENPVVVSITFPAVAARDQTRVPLRLDPIAGDDTVNIVEHGAGFTISGDTGSEPDVAVTVTVGTTDLTVTSASSTPATWSVTVPANAAYITESSVTVAVSATKAGFTTPSGVTRALAVDLTAPSIIGYTPSVAFSVGVSSSSMYPRTTDTDIASYRATGLPSGLRIDGTTGVIGGTPDTANASAQLARVTVTDTAGNSAAVSITFPEVGKGDQGPGYLYYRPQNVTFGNPAPRLDFNIIRDRFRTTVSYSATPSGVCTVNPFTGALTLVGSGTCAITATAPADANYHAGSARGSVFVHPAGTLALNLDPIATDDTVNIAEKAAGFTISGDTGSQGGVSVTVTVGGAALTTTSAASTPATWSVRVPANATYITETSGMVTVSAEKAGFTSPSPVTRSFAVDLTAPTVSYPAAPVALKVAVAIDDMAPSTTATDIGGYGATGLPPGLRIDGTTGVIRGTPDTHNPNPASATVTVTDAAGNPADVPIAFPSVKFDPFRGEGNYFYYYPRSVPFDGIAPTVHPPSDRRIGTQSYSATPAEVCTVDEASGAMTLVGGVGECVVTLTVAENAIFHGGTAEYTVTVRKATQTLTGFGYSPDTVKYRDPAPTLAAPTGAEGALSYSATPAEMCTVDETSGALTLAAVGECVVTATAAETANYLEATAEFTVTVEPAAAPALNIYPIAGDDMLNIAENEAGFTISGDTGSEAGVSVTVTVSGVELTAISSASGTWLVRVPPNTIYLCDGIFEVYYQAELDTRRNRGNCGTRSVVASASKTGFEPSTASRALEVDLFVPTGLTYTPLPSLTAGVRTRYMPTTYPVRYIATGFPPRPVSATPVRDSAVTYSVTGDIPSGLLFSSTDGTFSGFPDTANPDPAHVTVTATDLAGNAAPAVPIFFPPVARGVQHLAGLGYRPDTVMFGDPTPTLTRPFGRYTTLSYAAAPPDVCTVEAVSGALTLVGAGECVVTVTAEDTSSYSAATDTTTVTVLPGGAVPLNLDPIAGDDTVNIAEKAAGFTISGDTGLAAGASVTVTVGGGPLLTATSSTSTPATWSVNVPADAPWITGSSVGVTVNATRSGFTPPSPVTRELTVDLAGPTAPAYPAPSSLQAGEAITDLNPSGGRDIAAYRAAGLPSGLDIDGTNGVISGTPVTLNPNPATATVTVTDTAGNPATTSITFPAVAKGDQDLTGFAYSAPSVAFGDPAPAVIAPTGVRTSVRYAATPATVCTVHSSTGALTLLAVGACEVTATAPGTVSFNGATATFTVTVQPAGTLALSLDPVAGDDTVNLAEKAAGFAISGDTGTEAGVSVTVTVATADLSAMSAAGGAWSVSVPADAAYVTVPSVTVTVSAAKTGLGSPDDVTRTVTVDLTAPAAPAYTAPATLTVGTAIGAMTPSPAATGVDGYRATGLPSGLRVDRTTGVIGGAPDTANPDPASATVTVTDAAGNSAVASIPFPAVAKTDQTLTGFGYVPATLTYGDAAPTVTAPIGVRTSLSYLATPTTVCTVDPSSGELTIRGAGACEITATAALDAVYHEGTATATVTVQSIDPVGVVPSTPEGQIVVWEATMTAGTSSSGDRVGFGSGGGDEYGSLSSDDSFQYQLWGFRVFNLYMESGNLYLDIGNNLRESGLFSSSTTIRFGSATVAGDASNGTFGQCRVNSRGTTECSDWALSSPGFSFTAGTSYTLRITTTEPGPPQDVSAVPYGLSATLRWSPPSNPGGSPITGYKYRVRHRDDHSAWSGPSGGFVEVPGGASATSVVATGLTVVGTGSTILPSPVYRFQVVATNDSGDGLYSEEGTFSLYDRDARIRLTSSTPSPGTAGSTSPRRRAGSRSRAPPPLPEFWAALGGRVGDRDVVEPSRLLLRGPADGADHDLGRRGPSGR